MRARRWRRRQGLLAHRSSRCRWSRKAGGQREGGRRRGGSGWGAGSQRAAGPPQEACLRGVVVGGGCPRVRDVCGEGPEEGGVSPRAREGGAREGGAREGGAACGLGASRVSGSAALRLLARSLLRASLCPCGSQGCRCGRSRCSVVSSWLARAHCTTAAETALGDGVCVVVVCVVGCAGAG